jgi:hypothetical protein
MSILLVAASILTSLPVHCPPQGGSPVSPQTFAAYAAQNEGVDPVELRKRWPETVAEASDFTQSSRLAEVEAFLSGLEALPQGHRLSRRVFGKTTEGRQLTAVNVRAKKAGTASESVRVLINANIHGGEIEGKVAVQILLREFALGYHADLLESLDITFVPVFNADGNDRIARTNRVTQNGPEEGVGERANAAGLDLNRDFIKLETPEVRALTALVRDMAPHAFMDLHTTNGSPHGYDLTYSPSLSPNAPAALAAYMAESFFPAVRKTLAERDGIYAYDYGNFSYAPRERGSKGERGDPIAWSTYDSRPRFGTNLMGLRGTVSILSEAYSYLPYERRVLATYGFVLECLQVLAGDAERVIAFSEAAQEAAGKPGVLGVGARLDSIGDVPIRVSRYDEVTIDLDPEAEGVQGGERRVAAGPDEVRLVSMDVQSRYKAERTVPYTGSFLVLEPSDELITVLGIHLGEGALERLTPGGQGISAEVFVIEEATRSQRVFQGHREARVEGHWERLTVPRSSGALRVRASLLAAHLLHPESDDSFTTWNFFDDQIFSADAAPEATGGEAGGELRPKKPGAPRTHPVLMIR